MIDPNTELKAGGKMSKLIRRIEKLTALSQSPNEAEAAAAAAKVAELMMLHGIEASDLHATEDEGATSELLAPSGRKQAWKGTLLDGVCRLNGLDYFVQRQWMSEKGRREVGYVLIGKKANIIGARLTFDYLLHVVERLAKRCAKGRGAVFAASYRVGCAERLRVRLYHLRADIEADGINSDEGTCTALAVQSQYQRDDDLAKAMLDAMNLNTAAASKMSLDRDGYTLGAHAANSISLNQQIETGREIVPALEADA